MTDVPPCLIGTGETLTLIRDEGIPFGPVPAGASPGAYRISPGRAAQSPCRPFNATRVAGSLWARTDASSRVSPGARLSRLVSGVKLSFWGYTRLTPAYNSAGLV